MSLPICKIGLKKHVIKKDVFEREIKICQEYYKKKEGCGWGKCSECGVPFLLYKLYKGKLIEDKNSIRKFRVEVFKSKKMPK
ncbi:MAG: hypothetical protein COW72_02075 [Candidatus Nealsonbacteria bacterium CG18_big_fil_WC_8_21_14_2_50_37_10]|uniref:Uncharacterized protein n=1 Tax=Candidatus Nealsonbacteria bacterium CG18_big_fil_WC_8_21_14_2_50_37_10 TaxID=1974717 RepID=A0A2H0FID9_9BACT|nr:MAG: hypothetical protein COW72_02075 [Candidatus Nealsonbacteria bacterium CG18_big_fil_WC_8_21_14_2_50_37_10]